MEIRNNFNVNTNYRVNNQRVTLEQGFVEPKDEVILSSFGPAGMAIEFGKPSFFGTSYKNITKIDITNKRIHGSSNASGPFGMLSKASAKCNFDIPLENITGVEKTSYLFTPVTHIQYREGDKLKDLTVSGLSATAIYNVLSSISGPNGAAAGSVMRNA